MVCSILVTGNISDVKANEKTFFSEKDYEAYVVQNSSTFFESLPMATTQKISGSTEDITLCTYEMEPTTILNSNNKLTAETVLYEVRASGNKTEQQNDERQIIKGSITIFYEDAGNNCSRLTKVSGGYTYYPSGGPFTVTSQRVSYGMVGYGTGFVDVQNTQYPKGSTFSYNTNFTDAVNVDSATAFGGSYRINLKQPQSGDEWFLFINNEL